MSEKKQAGLSALPSLPGGALEPRDGIETMAITQMLALYALFKAVAPR